MFASFLQTSILRRRVSNFAGRERDGAGAGGGGGGGPHDMACHSTAVTDRRPRTSSFGREPHAGLSPAQAAIVHNDAIIL